MTNASGSAVLSGVLLLVSIVWLAVVGVFAWQGWPTVPLDMSPNDPATRAAHGDAVAAHVIRNGLLGIVPVLLGFTIMRLVSRRR